MKPIVFIGALALLGTPLAAGQQATLPPAADRPIVFSRDIAPLLTTSCVRCHGRGRAKGGFSLETRDALLKGGDSGPVLTPGNSEDSYLIALVAALDPDEVMPKKGSKLTAEQVGVMRAWIDQGAAWDPAVNFAKVEPRNLTPRTPTLPDAGGDAPPRATSATATTTTEAMGTMAAAKGPGAARAASAPTRSAPILGAATLRATMNPVDRLLAPYFAEHDLSPAAISSRRFARRLYFDLVGMPPSHAELRAFLNDRRVDKRERLIARLLADRVRYAEHWLSFWNDALRNDYRGPGFIDGGREQISAWLYQALLSNLPYDQFVTQLVDPVPGAEGFTKGIVWRGVVNASQTPPMQAAQNISQVFMGVNLKCASCHDSFINDWQLADAYGLAAVYADGPLEMVECDRPTGRRAPMKFLYPTLGTIDADAPRADRLRQLSGLLTAPQNGRLSRTIVNRLWARLMGRGLVEPVDDMEQAAWQPELLDWLAEDLVANGYDLKRTIARIVSSRAYQRPAVDLPETVDDFVFRGPAIRRLSAEQFVDALSAVTGVWQAQPDKGLKLIASHAPGTAASRPAAGAPLQAASASREAAPKVVGVASVVSVASVKQPAAGVKAASTHKRTRAALVASDPLMTALGRPTREQVITTRATAATTLQALELVNGGTLATLLRRGAIALAGDKPGTSEIVSRIYRRALGRAPTRAELRLARERLGASPRPDEIEDLLWAVAMLPEFQLLY